MSENYRILEKKWLTKNPLRQWRVDNGLFQKDLGASIGVGYHTIFRWESGMSSPNDAQMKELVQLTKDKNLQEKYEKWQLDRPKFGKE
jgi:DNA-binding XRE family transcriptional regulator